MDVLSAIRSFDFRENEKNIAVALSGGADSMALLTGLYMLKDELGLTLSALHLNHCLRAEESDRDQSFVEDVCKKLGIPLVAQRADVQGVAKRQSISIELAARQVRYDFFSKNAKGMVATAHNADDNLETAIYRLARATGINGLCGIPKRRDIYVRPLLKCTRQEIEAFLSEQGVDYVTDSTNLGDEYTRNKIRHNILPVLKEINPNVVQSFSTTSELLGIDRDFLTYTAKEEFKKRFCDGQLILKDFSLLHKAIATRVIAMFLEKSEIEANNYSINGVTTLALKGEGRFQNKDGKMVKAVKGYLMAEAQILPVFETKLVKQSVEEIKKQGKIHNLFLKNAIDCDKIVGSPVLRTRQSGDSITFSHRKVSKSLNKWMNEEGIEIAVREVLPVIADDKGVIWVYGGGVDKRVCPDENTKNIYRVFSQKVGGK
ncbi:MAG: tRNA lysidine(34) synthetase TilS [Acutalibacteraceae bacterium]|nr:tRNA lysidine(34) synthetase TilS [Acutalibacteraceae bacterium]